MGSHFMARAPSVVDAEALADAAVEALMFEAFLTPKPGLVDAAGRGAHDDMDVDLLAVSAESLRSTFTAVAMTASVCPLDRSLREEIGRLGREGESRMLAATGGVNTHRGAIWALGLLVAGAAQAEGDLRLAVIAAADLAALPDAGIATGIGGSHGQRVRKVYGVRGALGEAQAGFPHAIYIGLPAYQSRRAINGARLAALDALLCLMVSLDDTCVLHRGGPEALVRVQEGARQVLLAGGATTSAGMARLMELDRSFVATRTSPGGSADLLAATLFLDSFVDNHLPRWNPVDCLPERGLVPPWRP